jgi:large subunit ribosomal protein L24
LVRVIAGKDRGKTGKVLEVDRLARKVTVDGIAIVKKHTRPNPSKQIKGGIADKPMPIDVSNVMVLTAGGIPTRVGYKMDTIGGKVRRTRIARKGGETLDKK